MQADLTSEPARESQKTREKIASKSGSTILSSARFNKIYTKKKKVHSLCIMGVLAIEWEKSKIYRRDGICEESEKCEKSSREFDCGKGVIQSSLYQDDFMLKLSLTDQPKDSHIVSISHSHGVW